MEVSIMITNLTLDDGLIKEAILIGEHKSKKAAVTAALQEYIEHHKQLKIIDLFGTIEYASDYNYKEQRKNRTVEK